ncbi:MAG: fumarate reductase [Thermonema sp.]|jgi:succinate dehydrogenase / fumarate reductase cytochrome b subunit|uniref:succinate dehydrogenase cytochrome b subunit n=1 Tax=Thermonema TaxID=28194 RepID=UPI0005716A5D|nr:MULTISPECIES: succinate dehydrogenase cytochrome b subunit [Thermonema]GIV38968.1 MAG: fumarate reductase [Thermonema sp.]
MSWIAETLTSSVGRKVIMALTGFFLILFIIVHLSGNLQLLLNDGGEQFNKYAHFMGHNPLIQTVSILNFTFILLHVITSIILTRRNSEARPVKYHVSRMQNSSTWASRNMGFLGSIIFIFLVVHLANFWFKMKFGGVPMVEYDGVQYKDLFTVVKEAFQQEWIVIVYVVAMVALGYHLSHGFMSAFRTFGLHHRKYNGFIKGLGIAFSIAVAIGYAIIPVIIYFRY